VAAPIIEPEPAAVLSTAVVRAAQLLDLSQAELARTLGVSRASISRLHAGRYRIDRAGKQWEMALLVVRLFRSLAAIVGTGPELAEWLRSPNEALGGAPIELIASAEGLVRTVDYLDAARARV